MTRVLRRLALCCVLLALPAFSSADPMIITAGLVHLERTGLTPNPSFILQGSSFLLTNNLMSPSVMRPDPWALACSSAASGAIPAYSCRAGDTINLSFTVTGDLGTGSAVIDGRIYESLTYQGTLTAITPLALFQPADEHAFEVVSVQTTFLFTAWLMGFDGERQVFARALTGRGTAFMSYENEGTVVGGRPLFTPMGDGDVGPTYEFTAVPEPAALQLVLASLLAGARLLGGRRGANVHGPHDA